MKWVADIHTLIVLVERVNSFQCGDAMRRNHPQPTIDDVVFVSQQGGLHTFTTASRTK